MMGTDIHCCSAFPKIADIVQQGASEVVVYLQLCHGPAVSVVSGRLLRSRGRPGASGQLLEASKQSMISQADCALIVPHC
jgi:hypothetical protein